MKPRSAKNKGKKFQNYVRDRILQTFPQLEENDVKSTTMGESGTDVFLSPAAAKVFPYGVECKSIAKFVGNTYFDQARSNTPEGMESVVFVKENRRDPLVLISLEHFLKLTGPK
jgi:hypothetical protein